MVPPPVVAPVVPAVPPAVSPPFPPLPQLTAKRPVRLASKAIAVFFRIRVLLNPGAFGASLDIVRGFGPSCPGIDSSTDRTVSVGVHVGIAASSDVGSASAVKALLVRDHSGSDVARLAAGAVGTGVVYILRLIAHVFSLVIQHRLGGAQWKWDCVPLPVVAHIYAYIRSPRILDRPKLVIVAMETGEETMEAITLSARQARAFLEARDAGIKIFPGSLDLGKTQVDMDLLEVGVRRPDGRIVPWTTLLDVVEDPRSVFVLEDDELRPLRAFSTTTNRARSLLATEGAPAMLLSGVPLNRIRAGGPLAEAQDKVRALGESRGRVLDIGTGLGYTAVESSRYALEVVTVEIDPTAEELARLNPWSEGLFNIASIQRIIGDATELVETFEEGSFSAILLDAPSPSLAGDLYAERFYVQLHRLLSRRGRLFHTTGDPEQDQTKRTTDGVLRRLDSAGFTRPRRHPEAWGVSVSVGQLPDPDGFGMGG